MAIPTLDVPVALTKAELVDKEAYRGALNAMVLHINGAEYPAGSVVFVGFAGSYDMEDKRFRGHYKFRMAQPADSEKNVHDLRLLPQWACDAVATDEPVEPVVIIVPAEPVEPDTVEAPAPAVDEEATAPHRRRRRTKEPN